MKPAENIEGLIKKFYAARRSSVTTTGEMDKNVMDDALDAFGKSDRIDTGASESNIWRMTMKSKIIKLATAAVIIIAVTLGLTTMLDHGVTPVYAVEQTIKAIKGVKTVHMAGEFYKQGEFECWMKFAGDPDQPTYMWLGRTGHNLCKICSPAGVFGLNKRTNVVHFAKRDERGKDWVIKFGSLFEDAVRKAQKTDSIQIYNEIQPNSQKALIVVHIETQMRDQKFWVDPESKLPMRFATLREDAPMEMLRKTLALKNVRWIHYNEEPPEGIFDRPANAKVVEEEVDCMVDPDSGFIADGMTRQEACLAIVKQTGQALIDVDIDTLKKLDLFFRLYPPEIWEKIKQAKAAGQWVNEFLITGDAYQQGELWYVPCEIKSKDGKAEVNTPMIKFYEMEGHTNCFIIGSKEKGIVD